LLEKFKRGMELGIYRAHANQVGKDLDQVLAELGATMNLDALLWEVTDWWYKASQNGLAGRLHTRYLQYRKPLHILGEQMARAEEFKARIRKLDGISEDVKNQALANLDVNVQEIQRNMDFITRRGGWEGTLQAQKTEATERDALIPATNTACHQATREYFALAAAAKTIDSYELAESKYKVHVDLCVRN
jgi:hypothetical protein